MSADHASTMNIYFESWKAGDVARLRSILADDVVFDGPLAHLEGGGEWPARFRVWPGSPPTS